MTTFENAEALSKSSWNNISHHDEAAIYRSRFWMGRPDSGFPDVGDTEHRIRSNSTSQGDDEVWTTAPIHMVQGTGVCYVHSR